jgi:anti-sigma factor ChrR (cupin superfamily)
MAEQRDPPHASEEALARYALQQEEDQAGADDVEAQHIRECAQCQAEVARTELLLRQLDRQLYRLECPPVEQLTAYALGELDNAERQRVKVHVQRCARCTDEVEVTRSVLAPADPAAGPLAAVRRVLATLLPPQAAPASAPALSLRDRERPEADENETPRIFAADGVEVTLRSETERGKSVLYGTLHRADEGDAGTTPISVRLVQAPAEAARPAVAEPSVVATADVALDAFELGPMPSGMYQLQVLLADRVIVIPALTL